MTTAADIDALYQPSEVPVRICLDTRGVRALEDLEAQLAEAEAADATSNRTPEAPGIAERIVSARQELLDAEVEFVFRGIGRRAFTDLVRAHPATEEQQALVAGGGQRLEWNPDTFPPALLAAACVSPADTTKDWWVAKYDQWAPGQLQRLWNACLSAQNGVMDVPKARRAYAVMRASEPSSA